MSLSLTRRNWTKRRGALAAFGVILIADLALGSASLAVAAGLPMADAGATDSAVEVTWDDGTRDDTGINFDSFKDLKVTVGQTEALSNQGIAVTWTGGKTTSSGEYGTNYMQIMQCWSDQDESPKPTQCQWGQPASNIGNLLGTNAPSRNLVADEDPLQEYGGEFLIPPPRSNPNLRGYGVPFEPVKGDSVFTTSTFFSATSTNEVSAARTSEDGTGAIVFETQTSLEAPHLGCGGTVPGSIVPRACWLVVVPRGEFNADGSAASTDPSGRVTGSPLSASNWANRIEVKLGFQAISASCPIGNKEERTVGSELIAEAFTSWQTTLCGSGTTYGFSQIGDGEARRQIVSPVEGASGLGFVNEPLDETTAAGATVVYAPVVSSSIVVGFNIERDLRRGTATYEKNGTAVTDLVLNQRLVAKLLTQSYRADIPEISEQPTLANNPRTIRNDPEFLELNPEFDDFNESAGPDGLVVALGSSDANSQLWRWLQADADATDYLNGVADEWGMVINPAYLTLKLATDEVIDSFPKADLSTRRASEDIPEPGYGTLDLRPYMTDMHEAASRTRRADANVKIVWDFQKTPPAFVSSGPQLPGERFALTITDSTAASRYGLQAARLVNSAGKAVAPTTESVSAGIDALVPSAVEGVSVVDPDKAVNKAYPLSMLTYAAVNVCSPTLASLENYADLIHYAATEGQAPGVNQGQLPVGYVPLGTVNLNQAAKAEKVIRAEIKKPACTEHIKVKPEKEADEPDPIDDAVVDDLDDDTEEVAVEETPTPVVTPVALEMTVASDTGASRFTFLGALLLALPCLAAGPILLRRSRS